MGWIFIVQVGPECNKKNKAIWENNTLMHGPCSAEAEVILHKDFSLHLNSLHLSYEGFVI